MNELFTERWSLLLAAIDEVDAKDVSGREKLDTVARFIIDSYRYDPELMKVIIVEVTRAANSFGRTHLPEISPGVRVDREDRRPAPRSRASSAPTSTRRSLRCGSTGRSSSSCPAGCSS